MDPFNDENEIIAEPEQSSSKILPSVLHFIQEYHIQIIIIVGLIYYFYAERVREYYHRINEQRAYEKEVLESKKDPEVNESREEFRRKAIERLQEEYNKQAMKMKEVEKEKEEKKKEEFIAKHKNTGGRKLNEDYLPLAGGGSMGYRAPRRSGCPGGSCNR